MAADSCVSLLLIVLSLLSRTGCHLETCVLKSEDSGGDCDTEETQQSTFVMVKPDGLQRGLVGEIISRLEARGLKLEAMEMVRASRETVEEHYREHQQRPFFPSLVTYVTSGPVVAMVWRGRGAVQAVRALLGATDPLEATPGSIRGDLALDKTKNLCHASDSSASVGREIKLWLPKYYNQ